MQYVAFLDVLGFKDLVHNNDKDKLYEIYQNFVSVSKDGVTKDSIITGWDEETKRQIAENPISAKIVSDSIIIWTKDGTLTDLLRLVDIVKLLLFQACVAGLPLRGAISKGDVMELKSNIEEKHFYADAIFGTGIVNAYELEGLAAWSGCIIDDECATQLFEEFENEQGFGIKNLYDVFYHRGLLLKYPVPMKDGTKKEMTVINWVAGTDNDYSDMLLLSKFCANNKSIDHNSVHVKIANTIIFVRHAKSLTYILMQDPFKKK